MKKFWMALFWIALTVSLQAQDRDGYEITVWVEDFDESEAYIAQYYGTRPYLMDTTQRNAEGAFVFSDTNELESGMYFLVFPPKKDFLQIMVNEKEQRFTVHTKAGDWDNSARFDHSEDNRLFREYLNFIKEKEAERKEVRNTLEAEGAEASRIKEELEKLDQQVDAYKYALYQEYPYTVTGTMLHADLETPVPEFSEGSEEDISMRQFYFKRAHYLDSVDLADERLLRTPILEKKISFLIDRMTVQRADSLIIAIDRILTGAEPHPENFQYFFVKFLNEYGQSNTLGFDKILVHLVEAYINPGRADFLEEDVRNKLRERARKMKLTLIDNPAPPLTLLTKDKEEVKLYDIEADYMVLYFWKPSCPTCQKSTPDIVAFAQKYADQNVKVVGVCVEQGDKSEDCWPYVSSKGMETHMINLHDPYNRSRFYQKYDLTSTPKIMLLDKEKKILVNKMGAQQIEDLLEAMKKREE